MLNHSFGRYGLNINGTWIPNIDYANSETRKQLISETNAMISEYKTTTGLLMFLLGNENNYGLFWDGAETENIPVEDRKSTKRAKEMYNLFNDAVLEMKKIDTTHPIAMCNGDLLFFIFYSGIVLFMMDKSDGAGESLFIHKFYLRSIFPQSR